MTRPDGNEATNSMSSHLQGDAARQARPWASAKVAFMGWSERRKDHDR